MVITRAMVRAGEVPDLVVANGARVPATLRINSNTLKEHQNYLLAVVNKTPLSRKEALRVGYPPAEVDLYFGAEVSDGSGRS